MCLRNIILWAELRAQAFQKRVRSKPVCPVHAVTTRFTHCIKPLHRRPPELIRLARKEDVTSGDISTDAVLKEFKEGTVDLICKQDGIVCGLQVFERVFKILDETAYSAWSCGCPEVWFSCPSKAPPFHGYKLLFRSSSANSSMPCARPSKARAYPPLLRQYAALLQP